ncbi:E1-E2 ATPase family protein [Mycobacterium xenopi 4042]|uniref:E1-E2 ATPase family protein n=1 Tax=Mycobacterium xenopi 4042 TaxID=1299334 RepID=X8BG63_MYCXE|nr:E1-E2 ATPase family protein [Mycobacterium xenopi 4042]EUA44298.1 E1-E2 ATPase family protein [Mycobacterium xenopi 3993]
MGTLMTIAAAGAVALGQVGEAAMLAFLFSISEGLEEYAVARTRRGLRALLSLVPDQATVLREGIETVVAAADLRVGDQMIVKPGNAWLPTASFVPGAQPWTSQRSLANRCRSRPDPVTTCSPPRSTARECCRCRSPRPQRTTRWRASCTSWKPNRPAKAPASGWPIASRDRWCPAS